MRVRVGVALLLGLRREPRLLQEEGLDAAPLQRGVRAEEQPRELAWLGVRVRVRARVRG